jgi:hypothetical protein
MRVMLRARRTAEKRRVFRFIVEYKRRNDGIAPTLDEIAQGTGSWIGRIERILQWLEEDGLISRPYELTRYIVVNGGKWTYEPKYENTYDPDQILPYSGPDSL